jgi:hypothetical protein
MTQRFKTNPTLQTIILWLLILGGVWLAWHLLGR